MRYLEAIKLAFTALRAHKMRTLLTTLGITISVWTIVSVMAVIGGMNEYVMTEVLQLAPDVFVVNRFGIPMSREDFLNALKRKEISNREIVRLEEICQSCAAIGTTLQGQKKVHAGNRRLADVPIVGTTANVADIQAFDIEEGRYFTDAEQARRVAVIGSEIRDELFARVDPIGRTIWLGDIPHRVIGLIAKQGSVLGQSQDLLVYTTFRSAERLFGRQRGRDPAVQLQLLIKSAGGEPGVNATVDEVVQIFRWLRHIPFHGPDPVGAITAESIQDLWRQISFMTFLIVIAISSVSLVVGAIVVANIMIVSVIERTREIGLRLALGARKSDIRRQFLFEAAMLALVGGALGSIAGSITAWIVDVKAPIPATISPALIAVAMATAGITGIVAGFFPARSAAKMAPIEALNHD